ncbi:hypoxanthine/guanine phosphoribosyltransferase [Methanobrevibacter filiformis]|uniref:Hypoxanthine/guanine phosphoribosyltransferase n=1 Tax=Methanobrevibacter filiformis TaxID=55758 RepID=A0A162FKI3_9EURY|nr:hypoxanthine/guanine phosphoribosyltransferase [Methanobrevibacter filiformis]KZX11390.1 adenine phosphoribosyltransferase [Methanobrevibacter filiformis]
MLENLKKSLEASPVIKKGDYDYFVNPITDGIPEMVPDVLRELVAIVKDKVDLKDIDKIVCIEAMGIHLATALSLETDIPFVVIRKREYGLPGETSVFQETGYSKQNLYINFIDSEDNIIVIDDVVSTGGTLVATISSLKERGANVQDVIAIVEKYEGKQRVKNETGVNVLTLAKLDIIDSKPVVDILV